MPFLRRTGSAGPLLAVAAWLLLAGVVRTGLLDSAELQGHDYLVAASGFAAPSGELAVVDFDDAAVAELGFPIRRGLLAEVVRRVAAGRPELIGLDVLLGERRDPGEDAALGEALGEAGNVVLASSFATDRLPASEPLPEFRERALDVAFVNLPVDGDGLIRRLFLAVRTSDFEGTSFPVALASNYLGQPLRPGAPGSYRLGDREVPLDGTGLGTALIGTWSRQPAAQIVPVRRLLSPGFDARAFAGKIVLIGQSSAAAKDSYATPVFRFGAGGGAFLPGAEIHAAALATLLGGKAVRPLGPLAREAANLAAIAAVVALLLALRPRHGVPLALAVAALAVLAAIALYRAERLWLPFVRTLTGVAIALPAALGYRERRERRLRARAEAERRELMGLFERYVSSDVAAEIWRRRDEIVLAGQERAATVMFSDIRSFTALTAGKPSSEVLAWLNDYFDAMSRAVKENGGFLNKFIGDGLMVVFGAPLSGGAAEDAWRAVRAALRMLEEVERLNQRAGPARPRLAIGIGLHSGLVTAGGVGASDRLEYSVIGETVNLASRLEALTKELKSEIVISAATEELVRGRFETRPLGEAAVRGFSEPVRVYAVVRGSPVEVRS